MKKQNRRLLIALIVALLVILALVLVAGVCFSGVLWLNEQNESLRQQIRSLGGHLSLSPVSGFLDKNPFCI